MGTRHLIAVQVDGEYKVAQYGQWDGYPDGQGKHILEYLRTWDRSKFAANVRQCSWIDDETVLRSYDEFGGLSPAGSIPYDKAKAHDKKYPQWSRDTGARLLPMIEAAPLALRNDIEFAGDSLFCEWAYVVDLDKNVFEVYRGFNKKPVTAGERFEKFAFDADQQNLSGGTYYPVALLASFPLDNLPDERAFLEKCNKKDDEEDAA